MSRDGAIRFADARTGAGALSSSAAQLTDNLSYKEKKMSWWQDFPIGMKKRVFSVEEEEEVFGALTLPVVP
jgi:hypothetical protein